MAASSHHGKTASSTDQPNHGVQYKQTQGVIIIPFTTAGIAIIIVEWYVLSFACKSEKFDL